MYPPRSKVDHPGGAWMIGLQLWWLNSPSFSIEVLAIEPAPSSGKNQAFFGSKIDTATSSILWISKNFPSVQGFHDG